MHCWTRNFGGKCFNLVVIEKIMVLSFYLNKSPYKMVLAVKSIKKDYLMSQCARLVLGNEELASL